MQLLERRHKRASTRATRRLQRGGAPFSKLGDLSRIQLWAPHLKRLGISTLVTDRTSEPTEEEKLARISDFITILMKQDDLYQAALSIEKELTNVIGDSLTDMIGKIETIKAPRELDYIRDVEAAVAFAYVNVENSKWKRLRSEPFSNLVFYPWRASNILIRALADYLRNFSEDKDKLLDNAQFVASNELIELQGSHLDAYVRSQAWYLTDSNLSDGFFTSQDIQVFEAGAGPAFFHSVVRKIIEYRSVPNTELFGKGACKAFLFESTARRTKVDDPEIYADATARLYILYRNIRATGSEWSTLQLLNVFGENCPLSTDANKVAAIEVVKTYVPDEIYWDTPIMGTQTTFRSLLAQISPLLLNYLLRLSYALENPNAGYPLVSPKLPSSPEIDV